MAFLHNQPRIAASAPAPFVLSATPQGPQLPWPTITDSAEIRLMQARAMACINNYDADVLLQQYDRRSFGSLTTTIAGGPEMRRVYLDAWKIALAHERRQRRQLQAAE